ncbi:MAG: peptidoglycan/LPS O-acetylase OafA/YrhL [Flavobacteriales bacterium]|jgi:peptidoglycan/LPS O-acetylase OafA/YrhL
MTYYSEWINEFWQWDIKEITFTEFFNTFILIGPNISTDLFDPVIGTLRTEMQVSLVLPFLIYIALRVRLLLNFFILICFFYIGRDIIGFFYLGIMIAMNRIVILNFIKEKSNTFYKIIFLVISSFLYTSRFSLSYLIKDRHYLVSIFTAIGCTFFMLCAMKKGLIQFILNTDIVQFLDRISYSFYLLHIPILLIFCSVFPNNFLLIFLCSLIVTIVLSYLVYNFIGLAFIKIGKKISLRKLDILANTFLSKISIFFSKKKSTRLILNKNVLNENNSYPS